MIFTNLTGSNGALIFGNTSGLYPYSNSRTLDIVNYSTGNINNYLQLNSSGTTGSYNWFHGQSPSNLMTLTYQGRLGLGVTLPTNTIHVSGSSTVSGNSYVGSDLYVANNLNVYGTLSSSLTGNVTGNVTGNLAGNVNTVTGISTFNNILVNNITLNTSIGIGTTSARSSLDVLASGGIFGYVGIGTTTITDEDTNLYVVGNSEFYGNVSISGQTNLEEVVETLNTKTAATGTVVHDFSTGAIWYHSSISANFTVNLTNVPTTNGKVIT